MINDDFYASDDDQDYMKDADFNKISSKLNNDGYRIGKTKEDEKQVQLGFDKGFSDGIVLGKALGRLYGRIRFCLKEKEATRTGVSDSDNLLTACEVLFFEDIPESKRPVDVLIHDVIALVAKLEDPSLQGDLDSCLALLNKSS